MDKNQRSALRRFRRVQEFLTRNTVSGTEAKLQQLNDVIGEMTSQGEVQDANNRVVKGETARQLALREALRKQHMIPISRIARRLFGVPGMDVKLKLPKRSKDNEALLNAARGMAQAAEAHTDVFVKQEGLPENFLEQFRADTEALAKALDVRVESQNRRSLSREALNKLVKRGIAIVDVLDALVKAKLQNQQVLLDTWDSVKRLVVQGGGTTAESEEAPAQPVIKAA